MIIWIVFAVECLIFVWLCARVGKEILKLVRQLRQTMERIQPVIKEAQALAIEAAPVMQKVQSLAAEAKELTDLARQTQSQAAEAAQNLRQLADLKNAFLQLRETALRIWKPKPPQGRIQRIGNALASFLRPRPKRNWRKTLIPAGIGAFLGGAFLHRLKRSL